MRAASATATTKIRGVAATIETALYEPLLLERVVAGAL